MSEAMEALYAGDAERARSLLRPDDELGVFDAAAFGRMERLRAILDADPGQANAFAADGFTPLHLAIFGGQEAAARLLIDRGADVEAVATGSIARVAPLGTAVFVRSVDLTRLLLENGADVNKQVEGGFTVLHSAAQSNDEGLVRLLLENGADPNVATDDGKLPTDYATEEGVRSLLSGTDRAQAG